MNLTSASNRPRLAAAKTGVRWSEAITLNVNKGRKRMRNIISAMFVAFVLTGCATAVTKGQKVFITPANSAHLSNCEMLGQVQVDASITGLWDRNQQLMEIKNRLRDAAAEKYPEADTVTHSDLNVGAWSAPDAQAMGVAFKCFKK